MNGEPANVTCQSPYEGLRLEIFLGSLFTRSYTIAGEPITSTRPGPEIVNKQIHIQKTTRLCSRMNDLGRRFYAFLYISVMSFPSLRNSSSKVHAFNYSHLRAITPTDALSRKWVYRTLLRLLMRMMDAG